MEHDLWEAMHDMIQEVSQKEFVDGHYVAASRSAFLKVNTRVKSLREQIDGCMKDGVTLMQNTFAYNDNRNEAILPVVSSEGITPKEFISRQNGFRDLFSGSISAIRNPICHDDVAIGKHEAIRNLMLASLLMYKIDDSISLKGKALIEDKIQNMSANEIEEFFEDFFPEYESNMLYKYHVENKRGIDLLFDRSSYDDEVRRMSAHDILTRAYMRYGRYLYEPISLS